MRLLTFSLLCLAGAHALAQTNSAPSAPKRGRTALGGLELIPPIQAANLVSIFAREGSPDPERWYFLTFDPKAENGVAEFVVADQKLVASRNLSQFAERVRAADVAGATGLRIDSDRAAQVALDYAKANNVALGSINYDLKKEGTGPLVWTLACLDSASQPIGQLKIAANTGSVLSHEGFALEPAAPAALAASASPTPSPASSPAPTPMASSKPLPQAVSRPSPTPKKKPSSQPDNLGSKLKHFFTGH